MSSALLSEDTATKARLRPLVFGDNMRAALVDAAIITVACIAFLGLCLYQIQLPGLYPDEAFDVIPAMQLLLGHHVELQRNIGLHIFGLDLPFMSSSDYQGVTSTYLVLPFFALGGINVVSLRLMTVTVGLIGVILTYFLVRSWADRPAARLAVLLIGVSPAWVFWSRLGVYVVSQVMPIAAGSLLALTVWVGRRPLGRRNGSLYLGAFLLGLGLTTKLLFVWFIVALAITALILWGRPLWSARRHWLSERGRWLRIAAAGAFWFAVGAAPFLVYNVLSGGTFNLLRHTLSGPGSTDHGVNNATLLRNLWTEADAFRVLLDGSYFWFQGVGSATYADPLIPAFFAITALGLTALFFTEHPGSLRNMRSLPSLPFLFLAAALLISGGLLLPFVFGTPASLLVVATGLLGMAGTGLLVRASLRDRHSWKLSTLLLLVATTVAGTLWWFGGVGRPEGAAPGALLGLWPADAAGAFFWISGAGLMVLLGTDSEPVPFQRPITAALSIIGLIVAQSSVTVSGLWSTHLLVLLPLPQLIIASFVAVVGRKVADLLGGRNFNYRVIAVPACAVLFVGPLLVSDLLVDQSYHRDMAITGGSSTFSDAVYSLAGYLDNQAPGTRVVALEWGFKRPVQLLTLDRVNPDEAYGYEEPPSAATRTAIAELTKEPNTLFLFHTEEAGIAYPRYAIFAAAARSLGKTPTLERTFYQRDGTPVYRVYAVR